MQFLYLILTNWAVVGLAVNTGVEKRQSSLGGCDAPTQPFCCQRTPAGDVGGKLTVDDDCTLSGREPSVCYDLEDTETDATNRQVNQSFPVFWRLGHLVLRSESSIAVLLLTKATLYVYTPLLRLRSKTDKLTVLGSLTPMGHR